MVIERKLIKHCKIGELEFDLGLNRYMAINAYKKFPEYWDTINKSEQVQKAAKSKGEFNVDTSNIVEIMELTEKITNISASIVDYLLPTMLEYAENELPANISDYNEYAQGIIDYCAENGVYYNFIDEDTEEEINGFVNIVMEFVQLAFMSGGEKQKSKVKISLN